MKSEGLISVDLGQLEDRSLKVDASGCSEPDSVHTFEGWTADPGSQELLDLQGSLMELTRGEFDLQMVFLKRTK